MFSLPQSELHALDIMKKCAAEALYEAVDSCGNTWLHLSVLQNWPQCIQWLLEHGCNVNEKNRLGWTPIQLAKYLGHTEFLGCPPPLALAVQGKKAEEGVFDEEDFENAFGVRYTHDLHFGDMHTMNWCSLFLSTLLGQEQWEKERDWGLQYGAYIEERTLAPFLLKRGEEGFGLFATRPLKPGEWVGEYTGRVLRRQGANSDLRYAFDYLTDARGRSLYLIDAEEEGNVMRFINHSENPNVVTLPVWYRFLRHLIFVVRKPIAVGEQLLCHYGKNYWWHRIKD